MDIASFCILVALVAHYNLPLHHIDIKIAFLHGDLQENIYMAQPPHFLLYDPMTHVCKLNKPMFALKQSPCQWYKKLHAFLKKWSWLQCTSDPNLYYHNLFNGWAIIGVYVDDIPILASDELYILHVVEMFEEEFCLHNNGPIT